MNNKDDIKLIDLLPSSISSDQQVVDMSSAIQPEIDSVSQLIPSIEIYRLIDQLPEPVLRMLALENRVFQDEWQLAQTLSAKRQLIKNSFLLNQRRGTRWSIERVFELLNITADIKEWFEYDGDPFHFKISIFEIEGRGLTEQEITTALRLVNRYKPLRSAIDSIDVSIKAEDVVVFAAAASTMTATIDVLPFKEITIESFSGPRSGVASTMNLIIETYPVGA